MLDINITDAECILDELILENSKDLINKISKKYKIHSLEIENLLKNNSKVLINQSKNLIQQFHDKEKEYNERPEVFPKNKIKEILENDIKKNELGEDIKIDKERCMARVCKKGISCQCTRRRRQTFDYCGLHINQLLKNGKMKYGDINTECPDKPIQKSRGRPKKQILENIDIFNEDE